MRKLASIIIGLVLFGSIWGFAEATLGAILHIVHSPHKGAIMTSLGVMVMSAAAAAYKPRNTLAFMVGLGVIASLVKGLDLIFMGADSHVLRVMVVIPLEAAAFGAIAYAFAGYYHERKMMRPTVGALTAYASFALLASVYIYGGLGSKYWMGKGFMDIVEFTLSGGTVAAVLCIMTSDVGYNLGKAIAPKIAWVTDKKPLSYYLASLTLSGILWIARLRLV